jgi:tetratricopeptide (TPR) repeat protein
MGTKFRPPQGRLEAAALPRIVRDLWRAEATGILHLWNQEASKQIVFKHGDIVFAGTNQESERLGERLVRTGKIKRSVRDLAFRVMERSHERFGKTVVELGWVSPMEMQRAVAGQIKEIIYSVFTWHEGDYRFEVSHDPVSDDLALELHTAEVIYEGACRISDRAATRAGIGSWNDSVVLADGKRLGIPVTRDDGFILSRVDGTATIGDIVAASPLGEEDTLRRIYAMLLAGVIAIGDGQKTPSEESDDDETTITEQEREFRDAVLARHAALQFGNYYDRLGVDLDASGKKIRAAYEEVMASLEPKAELRDRIDDIAKQLHNVRRKVREAYEVLSVAETRWQYDRNVANTSPESTLAAHTVAHHPLSAHDDPAATLVPGSSPKREQAELLFLEAKRLYNGGDYFDAVASLNEALGLEPANGQYHRLLAQWLAQNPGCWETSQQHYERAIELDGNDVEAYLGLAALHEEASRDDKASPLYERILKLDPDNRVARDKLEHSTR